MHKEIDHVSMSDVFNFIFIKGHTVWGKNFM